MMLDQKSFVKLSLVHPVLSAAIVSACGSYYIIEGRRAVVSSGVRTIAEQSKLFREGKSRTMMSKHLIGMAVDIALFKGGSSDVSNDINDYKRFNLWVQGAAKRMGCQIVWGGNFRTFLDGPHFELIDYPAWLPE